MFPYINNTNEDVSAFHKKIMEAIENNGVFDDDFSDVFKLTKTPEGSKVDYSLDLV